MLVLGVSRHGMSDLSLNKSVVEVSCGTDPPPIGSTRPGASFLVGKLYRQGAGKDLYLVQGSSVPTPNHIDQIRSKDIRPAARGLAVRAEDEPVAAIPPLCARVKSPPGEDASCARAPRD